MSPAQVVLVADDESGLRHALSLMLESFGCRVILAKDGQEALDLYRIHRAEITVALLDLNMPQISGRSVLRSIRDSGSGIPIILMSGDSHPSVPACGLDEEPCRFLSKPFRIADIREAVSYASAAALN